MDHYKFCRLCLCGSGSLIDIFEDESQLGFQAEATIQDLLQFKVVRIAGMQWMACSTCLTQLIEFKIFKRRCIESKTTFEDRMKQMEFLKYDLSNSLCQNIQQVSVIKKKTDNVCNGGGVEPCRVHDHTRSYLENLRNPDAVNQGVLSTKIWYVSDPGVAPVRNESMQHLNGNYGMSNGSVSEAEINEIDIDEIDISHLKIDPSETEDREIEENAQVDIRHVVTEPLETEDGAIEGNALVDIKHVVTEPLETEDGVIEGNALVDIRHVVTEPLETEDGAIEGNALMDIKLVVTEPLETEDGEIQGNAQIESRYTWSHSEVMPKKVSISGQQGDRTDSSAVEMELVATAESQSPTKKLRKVKSNAKELSCNVCGKTYIRKKCLESHMISHRHGNSLSRKIDRLSHKMPVNYTVLHLGRDRKPKVCSAEDGNKKYNSLVLDKVKTGVIEKCHGRPPKCYPQGKTSNAMTRENSLINIEYRISNEYNPWVTGRCGDRPENPTVMVPMNDSSLTNMVEQSACDGINMLLAEPNFGQVLQMKKKPGRPRKDRLPKKQSRKVGRPKKLRARYPRHTPLKVPFRTNTSDELALECQGGLPPYENNVTALRRCKKQCGKLSSCIPLKIPSGTSVLDAPVLECQDRVPHEIKLRKLGTLRKRRGKPPGCVPQKVSSGVSARHEHGKGFSEPDCGQVLQVKRKPGRPLKHFPLKISSTDSKSLESRDKLPKKHQPGKVGRPKKLRARYPRHTPLKVPFRTNTSDELALECQGGLPPNENNVTTL